MSGQDGNTAGSGTLLVLRALAFIGGLGLTAVGAVAVFVSSNTSGTASLVAVGALLILSSLFGDRVVKAKWGDLEFDLAQKVKDHLRIAFEKRRAGNYEAAEAEIVQAFDRFKADLPADQSRANLVAEHYTETVVEDLKRVARRFDGTVNRTSATSSLFPLVDVVLELDGHVLERALEVENRQLCELLRDHLHQLLLVGVTIRPGPEVDPNLLVTRLRKNVQEGALNATCFLLIQNCTSSSAGRRFTELARALKIRASNVDFEAGGTELELDRAIAKSVMTICEHGWLPTRPESPL